MPGYGKLADQNDRPYDGGNPFPVQTMTPATGGSNPFLLLPTGGAVTPFLVKATPGRVIEIQTSNKGTSWAYIHMVNKASAPVPGTDSSARIYGVPPGGSLNITIPNGAGYSTGIAGYVSGGSGLQDTTVFAGTAGDVVINVEYV